MAYRKGIVLVQMHLVQGKNSVRQM